MKMLIELKKIRKVIVYGLYLLIILLPIGGALYLSFPVFVHNFIFYVFSTGTEYGNDVHFQWIGITAAIAAVGFIANLYWNKINFNANIKSKSRIDWMKTVRLLIAELGAYSDVAYIDKMNIISNNLGFGSFVNEGKDLSYIANDSLVNFHKTEFQLILYISESKDNKKLNDAINNVSNRFNKNYIHAESDTKKMNINQFKKYADDKQKEMSKDVANLMEVGNKYFKNEWERAKRGE